MLLKAGLILACRIAALEQFDDLQQNLSDAGFVCGNTGHDRDVVVGTGEAAHFCQ
jgi:hypothetical protein